MNTTFENELRKVFDKVQNLENKKYVGRAFYASIDKDIKLKAEFISTETHERFDAMKIRVLHKDEGELDTSSKVNIMSTYYATQAAVRTTQAVMKAVSK